MNLNPRKLDTISELMDAVERVEWKGYKVPGVRLSPGQECLIVQIRRALRELHPGEPAIAIYFPRRWVDDDPGWQFYAREEVANRWKPRTMDRITEGLREIGMIDEQRLEIANQVLAEIEKPIRLAKKGNYLNVEWKDWRGKPVSKRWSTDRKGAFFPSFDLPTGGTHTTAIAQLVYWVRHQPCLPIESWKYWLSPVVGMKGGDVVIPLLESSDYPKGTACVCCGGKASPGDWYYGKGLKCLPCFNEGK